MSIPAQRDKALDEAAAKGWAVVDMKRDWRKVFAFEGKFRRARFTLSTTRGLKRRNESRRQEGEHTQSRSMAPRR
jgi:hypothetical protein